MPYAVAKNSSQTAFLILNLPLTPKRGAALSLTHTHFDSQEGSCSLSLSHTHTHTLTPKKGAALMGTAPERGAIHRGSDCPDRKSHRSSSEKQGEDQQCICKVVADVAAVADERGAECVDHGVELKIEDEDEADDAHDGEERGEEGSGPVRHAPFVGMPYMHRSWVCHTCTVRGYVMRCAVRGYVYCDFGKLM